MKYSYARCFYACLIAAALIFAVPVRFVPKLCRIEITGKEQVFVDQLPTSGATISWSAIIFTVWLLPAVFLGIKTIFEYVRVRKQLLLKSVKCCDENILLIKEEAEDFLKIRRRIEIRTVKSVGSPLVVGIFRSVIILPDLEFSDDELKMIFLHELTHLKRCDLTVKLLCTVLSCVHWFNPIVYLLRKSINKFCEISCDEEVISNLSSDEKRTYGRLIISVIENSYCRVNMYTTAMASPKSSIKKRLRRIIDFEKPSDVFKVMSVVSLIAFLVCSVTAFGFEKVVEVMPEEIKLELTEMHVQTSKPTELPEATSASTVKVYKKKSSSKPQKTEEPRKDVNINESAYIFSPDFSEQQVVRSEVIVADGGINIKKMESTDGVRYDVYEAETDKIIITSEELKEYKRENSSNTIDGKNIYIVAEGSAEDNATFYIEQKK